MPNWNTEPPSGLGRSGIRLVRTPTAHAFLALVLSDNMVGCNTHYVNQRTIPCETPNCEPCENGIGWRWHGYLAVLVDATKETVLFETTALAAAAFRDYHQVHATLRGCHFKAVRLNQRPNGRLLIQAKPADLANLKLPDAPDVQQLLCHIWNIPPNQVQDRDSKPRPPFAAVRVDRAASELAAAIAKPSPAAIADVLAAAQAEAGNGEETDPWPDPLHPTRKQ